MLDLQAVFAETWQKSGRGRRIDYGKPLLPPPRQGNRAWADRLLAANR